MDISIILYITLILIGFSIGWLISNYQQAQNKAKQLVEREEIIVELSAVKQQILLNEHWRQKYESLSKEFYDLRHTNTALESNLHEITIKLESTQLHAKDKIYQVMNNEKRLNEQFENLANRVFSQNSHLINEQNRQSLDNILSPLREQLDGFRRQIQDGFSQEARERHTLVYEIKNLQQLNSKIAQEAINLTRALKGNKKMQGNWGEIILTQVLESSGLREGYEYETQISIETDTHSRMQPDVIVHIPKNKNVIIDAKMTLIAYEQYFNAEDECARELALQEHITSIRNHIRLLSRKNYHQLPGLNTLDYVLMFIPIEPAFLIAIDRQPELLTEALRNNIMLVSPTTLLVALRTITNLWHHEHQNMNIQQIVERASKLYDKVRLFVDEMSLIGKNLDRAQDSYQQAIRKLAFGRGNLLAQTEAFRSLGVNTKHEINYEFVHKIIDCKEGKENDNVNNNDDDYQSSDPTHESTASSTHQ